MFTFSEMLLRWSSRKAVSVPTSVRGGLGAPQRPAILLRQEPLDLSFLQHGMEEEGASSVKISLKTSKEKLVNCATEVAHLHRVSIQSCTQRWPSRKVQ